MQQDTTEISVYQIISKTRRIEKKRNQQNIIDLLFNVKGILSTTIVIFFIPKIIFVFRTDLHKMKIKHRIIGEYATKRCSFDIKKLTIVTGS